MSAIAVPPPVFTFTVTGLRLGFDSLSWKFAAVEVPGPPSTTEASDTYTAGKGRTWSARSWPWIATVRLVGTSPMVSGGVAVMVADPTGRSARGRDPAASGEPPEHSVPEAVLPGASSKGVTAVHGKFTETPGTGLPPGPSTVRCVVAIGTVRSWVTELVRSKEGTETS